MPYMVWKWMCTECCNMNGSEFCALPQSPRVNSWFSHDTIEYKNWKHYTQYYSFAFCYEF